MALPWACCVWFTMHSGLAVGYGNWACFANFNSLWPSDGIWRHSSWSTLVWVMACYLTAPSHNQCYLVISVVPWNIPRAIYLRVSQLYFYIMSLQIIHLKLRSHLHIFQEPMKASESTTLTPRCRFCVLAKSFNKQGRVCFKRIFIIDGDWSLH